MYLMRTRRKCRNALASQVLQICTTTELLQKHFQIWRLGIEIGEEACNYSKYAHLNGLHVTTGKRWLDISSGGNTLEFYACLYQALFVLSVEAGNATANINIKVVTSASGCMSITYRGLQPEYDRDRFPCKTHLIFHIQ